MSQAGISTHYTAQASLKLMVSSQVLGITIGVRYHTHLNRNLYSLLAWARLIKIDMNLILSWALGIDHFF